MADFLRSIGISGAVGEGTQQIINTAVGLRNLQDREALQGQQEELNQVDIARQRIGLKQEQDAATQRNTPRPMSVYTGHMTPSQQEMMTKIATDAGLATMVGNVPMMSQAQAEAGLKLFGERQDWQKQFIESGVNDLSNELTTLQGKKNPSPEDQARMATIHQSLSQHGIAHKELTEGPQLKEVPQGGSLYDVGQGKVVAQGPPKPETIQTLIERRADEKGLTGDAKIAYIGDQMGQIEKKKLTGKLYSEDQAKKFAKDIVEGRNVLSLVKVGFGEVGQENQAMIRDEINKLRPDYNYTQAEANYSWYHNQTTQKVLRRMNLLVDPQKGTFNEAIKAAQAVNQPAGTPINKLTGAAKVALGDNARNILNTVNALTGEEMAQIFGSGQGGQKFLELAQKTSDPNVSLDQYVSNVKEMKKIVGMSYLAYAEGTPLQAKAEAIQKDLEADSPGFMNSQSGSGSGPPKILKIEKLP